MPQEQTIRDAENAMLIAINQALAPEGLSIARATVDGKDSYHVVRLPRLVFELEPPR